MDRKNKVSLAVIKVLKAILWGFLPIVVMCILCIPPIVAVEFWDTPPIIAVVIYLLIIVWGIGSFVFYKIDK